MYSCEEKTEQKRIRIPKLATATTKNPTVDPD